MNNLPPLPALKAFEAAARHESFKMAANELFVTPSSISHQVRKLEDWLGTALFVRFNREVALTRDGKQYLTVVAKAFAEISDATRAISRHRRTDELHPKLVIVGNSGFIDCWLSSRLSEFSALVPDLNLELCYGETLADYRHRDADVAIHYGPVGPPTSDAIFLYRCVEFPVCGPDLRVNGAPIVHIQDLTEVTLYHEQERQGWKRWLTEFDAGSIDCDSGSVFQNTLSIFTRIEAGGGIALGDDIVAADPLLSGRLVKPLPHVRESDWSMYLLQLRRDRSPDQVDIFSDWLIKTLKRHEQATEELRRQATYPSNWAQQNE